MRAAIRILYIEDDLGSAELVRNHLNHSGYVVSLAADGYAGLELFAAQEFDVVLIDQTLPGIMGLDVLRELQKGPKSSPATIMLTGTGDESVAVAAMKAGADDYVIKSVSGTEHELLKQVILQVLDQRQLRQVQKQLLSEQAQLIEELNAFNYAVAHDLKQPLSVLRTSLYLARQFVSAADAQKANDKIAKADQIIVNMNATLDALIQFARVREASNVNFEPVDVRVVAANVLRQMEEMIRSFKAVVTIDDDMPLAFGYAPWIEIILINYLSNAIKYGGTPPRIHIGASIQEDKMIAYWIRDHGDGLSEQDQAKLFVPFSRLQDSQTEGHGLGLAIVSLVTRKLRGEAYAKSTQGMGSTFCFKLPSASLS